MAIIDKQIKRIRENPSSAQSRLIRQLNQIKIKHKLPADQAPDNKHKFINHKIRLLITNALIIISNHRSTTNNPKQTLFHRFPVPRHCLD